LAVLVEELGDRATWLDPVLASLSGSYLALGPPAARLFRLLGLHPASEIEIGAAASLAGLSVAEIRRPLAELTDLHLLRVRRRTRLVLLELSREYAAELADLEESVGARSAALARMRCYYQQEGSGADPRRPCRSGTEAA
jgi:DNA-binding transcriptional ArsR family regulator